MSLIVDCFRRLGGGGAPCRNELKGYKVTDANRTRKFGVACRSLQELKRKACCKLNVSNDLAEVNVFLLDGSLVDEEYFSTLEPQTTLILQRPGEMILSDADLLYDTLRRVNIDFLTVGEKASQFLTENLKAKVAVLNHALNKDDSKTVLSSREEHPEWFQGLDSNYTTKEAYMHRRCQDRIRGYLYKTIDQIKSSEVYAKDRTARQNLLQAIAFFKLQLKEDHYFGYYFDRSRTAYLMNNSKENVDEHDSPFDCYEHCPCRLSRLDDSAHFRLFGTSKSAVENTTEKNAVEDEVDARRTTDSKKRAASTVEDGSTEKECPYRVVPRDRKRQMALCNSNGEFRCEGVWNAQECAYGEKHRINPYRSKEELIIFSTWNLDHKIERARALVPRLLQICIEETFNEKDIYDCYDNLFTVKNLRLVHIVCHDKGAHE